MLWHRTVKSWNMPFQNTSNLPVYTLVMRHLSSRHSTSILLLPAVIKKISRKIAKELNISGPFNIQFLAKNNDVKVIECNLRASRSFPFVSKVLKRNFIETATRIMLDAPYVRPDKLAFDIDWIGVKASQFSFARLQNADPVLGVDMSSTGEVGCLGDDFDEALLNALIATGYKIPKQSVLFSSGATKSKVDLLDASRMLHRSDTTSMLQLVRLPS